MAILYDKNLSSDLGYWTAPHPLARPHVVHSVSLVSGVDINIIGHDVGAGGGAESSMEGEGFNTRRKQNRALPFCQIIGITIEKACLATELIVFPVLYIKAAEKR